MTEMKAFRQATVICWALLVSICPSFAQKIKITVFLGEERAEYSFIKLNSDYIGVCDADGEFVADADAIKPGDNLKAEFAGLSSNTVTCKEGTKEYVLRISNKELQTSNVSDNEIYLLKEYFRTLRYFFFNDPSFGRKYGMDYDVDYSVTNHDLDTRDSSRVELALLHENGMEDHPVFWETFGAVSDTLVTHAVATAWLYSMELLWFIHGESTLKRDAKNRTILLHKVISDNGEVHYAIIEGAERNNQTVICLDSSERRMLWIKRAFIGGGTIIKTTPNTSHTIDLALKQNKRTVSIDSVRLAVHIPEVNDTRTIIKLHSITEYPMSLGEQEIVQRRMEEYRDKKSTE